MTNFTGGLKPEDEFPLQSQPKGEPTFGENHAFWVFDEEGKIYINTHLNSVSTFWPMRKEVVSVCLPDGRALVSHNEGTRTTLDTVGGANLTMKCVEPFKHWVVIYQGTMCETTQEALANGPVAEGKRVVVEFTVDVTIAAPPFVQGGTKETARGMDESEAGRYVGGSRYEQLFRANVQFQILGERQLNFTATGTRTHRRGTRDAQGYAGHDWQSALFPNGDGFYLMRFPRRDGSIAWSEAYLLKDEVIYPATVLSDTIVKSRQVSGESLPIRLESSLGITEIKGETLGTIFRPMVTVGYQQHRRIWGIYQDSEIYDTSEEVHALSQGWGHYIMDGQESNGLCERSTFAKNL